MVDSEVTITVNPNGPYIVRGQIELMDSDGNKFQAKSDRIALCRCGQSSTKPFCDGTHRNGFNAPTKAS